MAAEMWFYTTEGKQMDPVSIRELRRLVEDGLLKPTDMVWKDGMARWIRASTVKELFPDPGSDLNKYFSTPAGEGSKSNAQIVPAAIPAQSNDSAPVQTKSKRPADDDDEPRSQRRRRRSSSDDDDDRPSRRGAAPKGGNSGLILIALLLGGGLVLFAVVVGVFILIFAHGGGGGGGRGVQGPAVENPVPVVLANKTATYVEALPALGTVRRTVKLQRGVTYEFTVRSEPRHPDVDLHILNNNGAEEEADDSFGPDSFKRWAPREDGDYKIELRNLDQFAATRSTVVVREVAGAPIEKKVPITEPPLPKDVLTGKGNVLVKSLKPGEEQIFKFRVKAGHNANVKLIPFTPKSLKGETNMDLFVLKDSDGAQIGADNGPGAGAEVNFTVQPTEIVRVRVVNAGKTTPTRSSLTYNVAP